MRWVAPLLLLASFAGLAISSMSGKSVTGDEVAHLGSGYSYLTTGDFRLNRQHPPLAKALAALPLLTLDLKPVEGSPGWEIGDEWVFGRDFLLHNRTPMATILFAGRLPMVVLGLLLALVLHRWAVQLWGPRAALGVLLLYVLSPNMLAHTRLVATDVGAAFGAVLTLWCLWNLIGRPSWRWVVATGLALGAALLMKYSSVITVALVMGLLAASALAKGSALQRRWRWVAGAALGIVATALLVVAMGFGAPHGLGNFVDGFARIHTDANPRWEAYLWGEYSPTGFRSYYLLAQLWKTPLPALILFGAAVVSGVMRRGRSWLDWGFMLAPVAAFHVAGILRPASIGIRHMLPVFPFLLLCIGGVVQVAVERRGWVRGALLTLGGWYVVSALVTFPDFIPYFNELAGGPANGWRYLDDSNIEWGQDVGRIGSYLEAHRPETVRTFVFEPLPVEAFGVKAERVTLRDLVWPEPGVTYLMGASYLNRSSLVDDCAGVRPRWLGRYRPVDTIGWSILVFRFALEPAAETEAQALTPARWTADATDQLRGIIDRCPAYAEADEVLAQVEVFRLDAGLSDPDPDVPGGDRSADGWYERAVAHAANGRTGLALNELRACLALAPDHVAARFSLGSVLMNRGRADLAREQWRACLRVDPGYRPAFASLEQTAPEAGPSRWPRTSPATLGP